MVDLQSSGGVLVICLQGDRQLVAHIVKNTAFNSTAAWVAGSYRSIQAVLVYKVCSININLWQTGHLVANRTQMP
jgi:hypothetical protein